MTKRLAFLDLLRIIAISLVTFQHISSHDPLMFDIYKIDFNFRNMYQFDWGHVGVVLFLFVSGFSLAITNLNIDSWKKIKEFYTKRILRIYPAYYVALLFSIILDPTVLQKTYTTLDYIKLTFGMQAMGATTEAEIYGNINGPLWFLTPLILLYLMFPIIAYAIKKHPHKSIFILFIINQVSLYLFSVQNVVFGANWWFPLCVVFIFGLGVYLFKVGVYPKTEIKNRPIIFLSKISFFVYLVNAPLLILADNTIIFVLALLVTGATLYFIDCKIRELIQIKFRSLKVKLPTLS